MAAIQPTNKSEKDKILDYVMETPHNTNRQILSNMIDEISEGGDIPTGSIDIHEDGEYDVTSYAKANVHIFLENYVNSCTVKLKNGISDKLSGTIPVFRYYEQVPEGWCIIRELSTSPTAFDFISEIPPAGVSINSGRYYLDLEVAEGYTPTIDTDTTGNNPKINLDSDANKYYLYDLTDGDEVVLTVQKIAGGNTGHGDA